MTDPSREAQTTRPAPVPFRGTGLAGKLWTATLVLLGSVAGFVVLYILFALADSWSALAAFGFAWICFIVAIAVWAAAVLAAAAGRGQLAGAVLALGAAVFALVAVFAVLSLPSTGEPRLVWSALVAALLGCVANVSAWLRGRQAMAATASSP